jgi:ACS family tartrate transporter-like MFS transporter
VLHFADQSRGCGVNVDPAPAQSTIQATTIRKLRTHIIPFVFILFVINFVDRINIGFAALTMNKELAITSQQFGLLSGIFFWGYFIFEIPSNLLLHKLGARIWIARILVSWGIVAILTGFVRTATHLYLLRFLLGLAEAGFVPGMYLYLTYWFPQRQLAHAISLFNAAGPVASIVGAPISGVILDHIHWLGLGSWRWLLILEGIPAVVDGITTYLLLPSRPADARFLTPQEANWVASKLAFQEQRKAAQERISVSQTLAHTRVWHLTAAYFAWAVGQYTMIFWMPQLVKTSSSQYSNTTVGILVMIPYVAALIAMMFVAYRSDRMLERRYHAAIPAMIAGTSLVLLGATAAPPFVSLIFWCFAAAGVYSLLPPFWSMPNEFLSGFSAAAGIAFINSFGNIGGFAGTYGMGAINKQTGRFHAGLVVAGVSLYISAMLILALRKRIVPETVAVAAAQATTAVLPTAGIEKSTVEG